MQLREYEDAQRRLSEYFEKSVNVINQRKSVLICMGMKEDGRSVYQQRDINHLPAGIMLRILPSMLVPEAKFHPNKALCNVCQYILHTFLHPFILSVFLFLHNYT